MIIYQSTIAEFLDVVFSRDIEIVVLGKYQDLTGRRVAPAEIRSWKESLFAVAKVLRHESIPNDGGMAIEYIIPQTAKRIDLLVSGFDDMDRSKLIIIELKQWETATRTDKDGVVRTRFAQGDADTSHPSYQASTDVRRSPASSPGPANLSRRPPTLSMPWSSMRRIG
jgi:uncharacterized protein